MVLLHVKRGDESQFLLEVGVNTPIAEIIQKVSQIYNARLKVQRLCCELSEMAEHGVMLPPEMQGLTEEQVQELGLRDEYGERCVPSGGAHYRKDEIGRRNGQAPSKKMQEVIKTTVDEATALVSKKQVLANVCVTEDVAQEAIHMLRGAVTIVYPMGLPPYEPVRAELENHEDLGGLQAGVEVIPEKEARLWWAGKELEAGKTLKDYVGPNEKTKAIVKLQKRGQGPPAREPVVSEEEKKQMMLHAHRRQQELQRLEEDDSNSYLGAAWADMYSLKRQFQGVKDIKWHPH
uniref:cilia- and flagella-associated protein 298 isoform X2 n=1 Tax=Myxine glutinosa TaxID=7769 RepID=UPI00358F1FDD